MTSSGRSTVIAGFVILLLSAELHGFAPHDSEPAIPTRSTAIVFEHAFRPSVLIPREGKGAEAGRFAIYLSAPIHDGYIDIDQGILDSLRDLRNQFARMKAFAVVDDRKKADMILTVVMRGVGPAKYAERLTYWPRSSAAS